MFQCPLVRKLVYYIVAYRTKWIELTLQLLHGQLQCFNSVKRRLCYGTTPEYPAIGLDPYKNKARHDRDCCFPPWSIHSKLLTTVRGIESSQTPSFKYLVYTIRLWLKYLHPRLEIAILMKRMMAINSQNSYVSLWHWRHVPFRNFSARLEIMANSDAESQV